jgi:hypothetical protein
MGGLRSRMDYQRYVSTKAAEDSKNGVLIADINAVVLISGDGCFQMLPHPFSGGFRPEKVLTHIIVNTNYTHPFGGEMADRL